MWGVGRPVLPASQRGSHTGVGTGRVELAAVHLRHVGLVLAPTTVVIIVIIAVIVVVVLRGGLIIGIAMGGLRVGVGGERRRDGRRTPTVGTVAHQPRPSSASDFRASVHGFGGLRRVGRRELVRAGAHTRRVPVPGRLRHAGGR